jgi:hypothetical protein
MSCGDILASCQASIDPTSNTAVEMPSRLSWDFVPGWRKAERRQHDLEAALVEWQIERASGSNDTRPPCPERRANTARLSRMAR